MSRFIYPTLFTLLFFFCVALLFRNYKISQGKVELYKEKIISCDQYYKLMLFRENAVMQNNGIKLSPNITLLSENNSVTSLSNAIGDVPKVIIRYSALACDLCLEEELKQISNYILKIGAENVLVFTSNENIRSLTVRKRKFPFNLKTYIIEDISIPFDEKNNNLFVFVLDKDFFVKDFFIPEKTLHSLSEYYYKTIQNKYWQ